MSMYWLPTDPATPVPLPRIRAHARSAGYLLQADRHRPTFTLFDRKTRVPLADLDHVSLPAIVDALDQARAEARAEAKRKAELRRRRRLARKAD